MASPHRKGRVEGEVEAYREGDWVDWGQTDRRGKHVLDWIMTWFNSELLKNCSIVYLKMAPFMLGKVYFRKILK